MADLLSAIEVHLMEGLLILLLAMANLGGGLVLHKLQIMIAAARRAEVEDAATKALSWGIATTMDLIHARGWDAPEVRQAVLDASARYAVSRFPDVMKRSGIPLATPTGVNTKLPGILERKYSAAQQVAQAIALPPTQSPVVFAPLKPEIH
jgi:hypothetical protein